jgi:curved DNA-binding protein CbpA
VSQKTYYELLEIAPSATSEEIKRSFRLQIARYHPDKVQHLGKEFQDMAAGRAAELTEAYRILSDEDRRAEYDRTIAAGAASAPAPTAPQPPAATAPSRQPYVAPSPEPWARSADSEPAPVASFVQERATRDQFVRKALLGRFVQALEAVAGDYDRADVRGFDVACTPKTKLFVRGKGPRLLGRFVSRVDAESVADTWTNALKTAASDEVCVFLMGSSMASAGELATAIADQRRKSRGARVTLIPIDARDWDAKMPTDAPPVAKTLLARLRTGA